ncbi:hypothetical protein L7F22_024793 [Adiantum nelumboides]|nr:hypothetical protein [Adiantum nelumboides]
MSPSMKDLDLDLAYFLESYSSHSPNKAKSSSQLLFEELLCCCERARHAIKGFTNRGDDSKVADCFAVAGDALCDLQWCLVQIYPGGYAKFRHGFWKGRPRPWRSEIRLGIDEDRWLLDIEHIQRVLFPLMSELCSRSRNKPGLWIKNKLAGLRIILGLSVGYSSDVRDGCGSARLPPGLNVDDLGEIEYIEALGEGSEGIVHKAMWSSRLVAVKEVFSDTLSEGLEALSGVHRSVSISSNPYRELDGLNISSSNPYSELDVLKTLNHPNIVELKGYTRKVKAGKYGLVMELMECSLQNLIASETLSYLVKVNTLLQVARGMHFLHTVAGIMHCDLKPANILIQKLNYLADPDARLLRYVVAKIADFGLSKGLRKQEGLAEDRSSLHTHKKGTSFYMAPEVRSIKSCKKSRYAMSADVFSFGTTCFNVLTGEEEPCTTTLDFYDRIKRRDLDQLLQNCGASQMALLVRQCWCPDPNSRPWFAKICQILEEEKRRNLVEQNRMKLLQNL